MRAKNPGPNECVWGNAIYLHCISACVFSLSFIVLQASRFFLLPENVNYGAWPALLAFISAAPSKLSETKATASAAVLHTGTGSHANNEPCNCNLQQDVLLAALDVMRALLSLKGAGQANQVRIFNFFTHYDHLICVYRYHTCYSVRFYFSRWNVCNVMA